MARGRPHLYRPLPPGRPCLCLPQVQTLRKYTKQFEVQGVHPTSSKEDIAKAVTDHWNSVVRAACAACAGACCMCGCIVGC